MKTPLTQGTPGYLDYLGVAISTHWKHLLQPPRVRESIVSNPMTANLQTSQDSTNDGVVVAVRGSAVDVRFDEHLPPIHTMLRAGERGHILIEVLAQRERDVYGSFYVFHDQAHSGTLYEPVNQRLLPLDTEFQTTMSTKAWPKGSLPQVVGHSGATLRALLREYLFISLFRACAESLASENASRLAAMQRAEKNIGELLDTLKGNFHRLRQEGIDEELFDVVSGYEALAKDKAQGTEVG